MSDQPRDIVPEREQLWSEKRLELAMREYVKEKGGVAEKYNSQSKAHVPDRLIVLPDVRMFTVEAKAWKCRPTTMQMRDCATRLRLGQPAYIIDNMMDFRIVIDGARIGQWEDPRVRSPQTPTYLKWWESLHDDPAIDWGMFV